MSQRLYKTIYDLARTVNSSLEPSEVMAAITKKVAQAMDAMGCFIRVLDSHETMLEPGGHYGLSDRYARKGPVEVDKSRLDQEVLKGHVVVIDDVCEDSRFQYPKEAQAEGIVSLAVVPLNARDKILGVLRVYSGERREFNEEELDFLRCIANLSGLALENARMYKALKRTSELADDFNYRVFEDQQQKPASGPRSSGRKIMAKIRVGINGFGRIGRQVLKTIWERHRDTLEVVAVNDLFDIETNAHLLRHDTCYKSLPVPIAVDGDVFRVSDDFTVRNFAERDPRNIPWGRLGVDVVVESTGIFRTGPAAAQHIQAGAKKVVISAPGKDEDITLVMGVNHHLYDPVKHHIVSNASCTTNCLAPIVKVIHEAFGISKGVLTTVHAYTNDQRILDMPHKDLRRARAAACNMIPTSTGAAKAVGLVIPEMQGRFDGFSVRVPTPTVSLVDFVAVLEGDTDTESLKHVLREAAQGSLKGIMAYSEEPMVSSDYVGNPNSGIVEADFTMVQSGNLAKVYAWYDNEWGYSCRVADLIDYMAGKGL